MVLHVVASVQRFIYSAAERLSHGHTSQESIRITTGSLFKLQKLETRRWNKKVLFGLVIFFIFCCFIHLESCPGPRLWTRNLFSPTPSLEELKLFRIADNKDCWNAHVTITEDKTHQEKEVVTLIEICLNSHNSTEIKLRRYLDPVSATEFNFDKDIVQGGTFQKIANEIPCIGRGCPPVSVSGNYIGIPTTTMLSGATNYYIFLLPTLAPRKHGVIDKLNPESIHMLWNDVINYFRDSVIIRLGLLVFIVVFIVKDRYEQSSPDSYVEENVIGSVFCKAKLSFISDKDVIVSIEGFYDDTEGAHQLSWPPQSDIDLSESAANEYECGDNSLPVVIPEAFHYMDRTLPRSCSCPDLRRKLHVGHYDPLTIDYYLSHLQRSEESSVSESLVSVHQEENKFRGATILVLTNSKTSMSDTSYDCDTRSVSSMNAVEDTHAPPLNNVIFNRKGVVIDEYSEQIRQDPVGGE